MSQAMHGEECVGAVVCKLEAKPMAYRGYIAMLAVNSDYRGHGIGR
jgi:ribosomal protein S18 acetylase RimI-like enzyme